MSGGDVRASGAEPSGRSVQKPFEMGGERVDPGQRSVVDLPIGVLSNHTPVVLSTLVIHGRRPGPVMFVSAALHGDELLGVEIIRRLVTSRLLRSLSGTVLAVPVVNAFGFLAHSRYLPDRRDLNRSFPGNPEGSLAAQLAHLFLTQVIDRSDFGIDLHTGAIHRSNLPQLRVANITPRTQARAEAFAPPVILKGRAPDGSLRAAANDRGKHVLLYEAGEALRFDEFAVRVGLRGILSVMRHEGMIPERSMKPPRTTPVWLDRSQWVRAPQGGVVRALKPIGATVAEGEAIAMIADPFGHSEVPVVSPVAGVVIGRSNLPTTNRGDALFHVADAAERRDMDETLQTIEDAVDDPLLEDALD